MGLIMKSRIDAVKLINNQLEDIMYEIENDPKNGAWHYGRLELKALMDFIYEDMPKNENEEISSRMK